MLEKIDLQIDKFKAEHKGEMPLYLILSPYDADKVTDEVRRIDGHSVDVLVTSYNDIKIVKHDILNEGEFLLSNELPETGS